MIHVSSLLLHIQLHLLFFFLFTNNGYNNDKKQSSLLYHNQDIVLSVLYYSLDIHKYSQLLLNQYCCLFINDVRYHMVSHLLSGPKKSLPKRSSTIEAFIFKDSLILIAPSDPMLLSMRAVKCANTMRDNNNIKT